MKKIFIVLLIAVGLGYGQRLTEKMVTNNGVTMVDRTFTKTTSDTTRSIDVRFADDYFLGLSLYDSGRVYISYETSNDKVVWTPKTTLDSVITTSNAGSYEVWDLTTTIRGTSYLRLFFDFASGYTWVDSTAIVEKDSGNISAFAYNTTFADTSVWMNNTQYREWNILVASLDSARIYIGVQYASDTTNAYDTLIVVDSLVTTDNAGGSLTVDADTLINDDSTYVRVVLYAPVATFGQGISTATYSAWHERSMWFNGTSSNQFDAVASRKED